MMGLGGVTYGPFVFTPTASGKVMFVISGGVSGSVAASTIFLNVRYGTGIAPPNGALPTGGTSAGIGFTRGGAGNAAAQMNFFTMPLVLTGLTVGTQLWFDLSLAVSSGNANLTGCFFSAVEIP
jgi:hypothetical protein